MGLTEKEIRAIRDELDSCKRPLFFFDDDPDGLCSFVLLYRYKQEGKGIPVKTTPRITTKFLRKVEEYDPDKIFILDTANVDEEFVEAVKVPIIWIDHHGPADVHGVKYFNPLRNADEATCTTDMCYRVVDNEDDIWIAGAGIVSDWQYTDVVEKMSERYPELLDPSVNTPEKALFDSQIGKLARIFSFMLMGDTRKAMTCVKILTRIKDPYEILNRTTSKARYIMKRFDEVNKVYEELLSRALKTESDGLLLFEYENSKFSLTKDLSNEMLYRNPDKVVMISRRKDGEMKLSLRSARYDLPPILSKALMGVEGFGGGHEHACGACVKEADFPRFLEQIKEQL